MSLARPALTLPPEPHIPGRNARPDGACFHALKADLHAAAVPSELAVSHAFQAGLEALSRGYYWEAHELLEAVWVCLPPASAERHLLRGLIQLANAGLKVRMARPKAVGRILPLAESSLDEAFLQGQATVMSLGAAELARYRNQIDAECGAADIAI